VNGLAWALVAVVILIYGFRWWQRRGVEMISVHDVKAMLDARQQPLIVDVREPAEFRAGHIPGAVNIPLGTLEKGAAGFDKQQELMLICRSGNRSVTAYARLKAMGFAKLKNVDGGMLRWAWHTDR
jgi:rhodanese-related sulfurtransferase